MTAGSPHARAQVTGFQPRHCQQPHRAVGNDQRPDQRAQAERLCILFTGMLFVCVACVHCLSSGLWLGMGNGVRVAKRVLVVEDNELNLKLFCDLLRAHEFAVEPVRDGREAVARARDFAPDLVIMDIQMPHVTGYELILELKADETLAKIPVMAVTAYAGRDDEDRIRAAGADAYVSKPISLARFMDAVGALV